MAFGKVTRCRVRGEVRYLVEWRDPYGVRRSKYFETEEAANRHAARLQEQAAITLEPSLPPDASENVAAYAAHWLTSNRDVWAPKTWRSYNDLLQQHVLPFQIGSQKIGTMRLSAVSKAHAKALVVAKRNAGFAPDTVRLMFAALRAMLSEATEDEVLALNPLSDPSKTIRKLISRSNVVRPAMTSEQLGRFEKAARASGLQALFLAGIDTGMRVSELRAWQIPHVQLETREGLVTVSLAQECSRAPLLRQTKTGRDRIVDLTDRLIRVLGEIIQGRSQLAVARGWRPVPPWLFVSRNGTPLGSRNVQREFARVLTQAKLDGHGFTMHSLRHTFATLHLQTMERDVIQWVQQQLGHSSIKVTVDTYGATVRLRNPKAADYLERLAADSRADSAR